MAKKLTAEQVEARLNMYEEASVHLSMSVHETEAEVEQSKIVASEINKLMIAFGDKYAHVLNPSK